MSDRKDKILWRIARLHPGWMTAIVWLGYVSFGGYGETVGDAPFAGAAFFSGFMLLYMGYPLFILVFVSGRFRTWSPPRPGRALAAFFAMGLLFVAGDLAVPDVTGSLVEAANAGDVAANVAFALPFTILVISFFYLIVGAALVLVAAERGRSARTLPKIVTFLQFFCLPFCVYFLHRRVRRLVRDFERGDPIIVNLPLEALKTERQADGHLSLLLTECIGWDDFERYAEELLRRLDGRVYEKGAAADLHVWNVEIETLPFRLIYNDFPNGVTLESKSRAGDMLLSKLHRRLQRSSEGPEETGPPQSGAARFLRQPESA